MVPCQATEPQWGLWPCLLAQSTATLGVQRIQLGGLLRFRHLGDMEAGDDEAEDQEIPEEGAKEKERRKEDKKGAHVSLTFSKGTLCYVY